jgi:hypothetical protein
MTPIFRKKEEWGGKHRMYFRFTVKKVIYTYILLQYHFRTTQLASEMPATGEGYALRPDVLFSVCSEYVSYYYEFFARWVQNYGIIAMSCFNSDTTWGISTDYGAVGRYQKLFLIYLNSSCIRIWEIKLVSDFNDLLTSWGKLLNMKK